MTRKIVTPERGWVELPVRLLRKAPWNYKSDNPKLIEKLTNNIKRNGFILNVVVREVDQGFYELVDGNHRLDVLNAAGIKTVKAYNLGPISENSAKRISVELSSTEFTLDYDKYLAVLSDIVSEVDVSDLLSTVPLSSNEIDILKSLSTMDSNIPISETDVYPTIDSIEDDQGQNENNEIPTPQIPQENAVGDEEPHITFLKEYSRMKGIEFDCNTQIVHLVRDIQRLYPNFLGAVLDFHNHNKE